MYIMIVIQCSRVYPIATMPGACQEISYGSDAVNKATVVGNILGWLC